MELTNGKLTIGAGYTLKVGLANYSSNERSAWIGFEFDLPENTEEDTAIDAALLLEAKLDTNLKLVVATALGVSVDEVEGTLIPILPEQVVQAPKSGGFKGPRRSSKPKASGGGGGSYDNSDITHAVSIAFGGERHDVTVLDQRDLKKSGKFSEKSPDFKLLDFEINGSDGVWMRTKAGTVNKIFAQIAEQIDDSDANAAAEDATWD